MQSLTHPAVERFCIWRPTILLGARTRTGQPPTQWETERAGHHSAVRFVLVTWLPFVALALAGRAVTGVVDPMVNFPEIHARLLLGGPLCLIAHHMLINLSGRCLQTFAQGGYARPERIARIAALATRVRDGRVLEIVTLVAAYGIAVTVWGAGTGGLVSQRAETAHTMASAFYGLVALPLFIFVVLRWLVHWTLWNVVLFALSRRVHDLPLGHPDGVAGLSPFALPTRSLATFAFAMSSIASSVWTHRILVTHVPAMHFLPGALALAISAVVLGFGPLSAFAAPLYWARIDAVLAYGSLGNRYVRRFEARWLRSERGDGELLGTSDIQSLADLGQAHRAATTVRPVPFNRQDVLLVLAAALAPMLAVVLAEVPVSVLLKAVVNSLVGRVAR